MKPIRVLLADDHSLLRAGLRALLSGFEGVEVVGEAGDGREALQLLKQLAPDVLMTDIAMPGLNGLEAAARVAQDFPEIRVLILSMHATEEYVLRALRAGAAGYLLKEADPTELELALRAVARGETYLTPSVSKHVITDYLMRLGDQSTSADLLTPRQREILQLIAEGHSTKEIASLLHLSIKTVETHRAQLMERLDIRDVAGLVRYSIRIGLVCSDA
jgi:DNA-binding NarL/FixJ family response regulator